MSDFQRAAKVQLRVIGALMLRDLVVDAGRGSIPFLGIVLRPTAMILGIYLLGRYSGRAPNGFPLLQFIVTGYLTWVAFIRCFNSSSIKGSVKLLMIPHVTPLDLILSKLVLEFAIYTMAFVGFCFLAILFEQGTLPYDPLGVILAFWSAIGLGIGVGMIAACIRRFTTLMDEFFVAIRLIGHAASGVFALATDTPAAIMNVLRWNPLFHAIEWQRESWWPHYKSPIADPAYIGMWLWFLLAIGLSFERATRRWETE